MNKKRYEHYNKGGEYVIIDEQVSMQVEGEWIPAILYRTVNDPMQSFVRERQEFFIKFKEVK